MDSDMKWIGIVVGLIHFLLGGFCFGAAKSNNWYGPMLLLSIGISVVGAMYIISVLKSK